MGEFSEKDVRVGLKMRGASGQYYIVECDPDADGRWGVRNTSTGLLSHSLTAYDIAMRVDMGTLSVLGDVQLVRDLSGKVIGYSKDISPPTQRSGRRFDGVTVRRDEFACTGRIRWLDSAGIYQIAWSGDSIPMDDDTFSYTEEGIAQEIECGHWRIVSKPQPDAPKDQPPRFAQPRFAINALWSQLPPFPHYIPDHVHPSAEGIDMFERSPADKPVSPRDASRRAIDETVRGLRDQPFAAAIQAVLVSACTEGKTGERILSRDDIDSMVAACRAWEECRGKVAPGRRTLTPEQTAKCWDAATKAGMWLGGSGEVYERARTL